MNGSSTVVVAGPLVSYAVEIDERLTALGYAQSPSPRSRSVPGKATSSWPAVWKA